ncbi:MAG: hypothetical protein ACREYF_13750 [Gammaproteobacteria bacterium]
MLLNHTATIPLARTLLELAKAVPVPVTFEHERRAVALSPGLKPSGCMALTRLQLC